MESLSQNQTALTTEKNDFTDSAQVEEFPVTPTSYAKEIIKNVGIGGLILQMRDVITNDDSRREMAQFLKDTYDLDAFVASGDLRPDEKVFVDGLLAEGRGVVVEQGVALGSESEATIAEAKPLEVAMDAPDNAPVHAEAIPDLQQHLEDELRAIVNNPFTRADLAQLLNEAGVTTLPSNSVGGIDVPLAPIITALNNPEGPLPTSSSNSELAHALYVLGELEKQAPARFEIRPISDAVGEGAEVLQAETLSEVLQQPEVQRVPDLPVGDIQPNFRPGTNNLESSVDELSPELSQLLSDNPEANVAEANKHKGWGRSPIKYVHDLLMKELPALRSNNIYQQRAKTLIGYFVENKRYLDRGSERFLDAMVETFL